MKFLRRYKEFLTEFGLLETLKRIVSKPIRIIKKSKANKNFIKKKEKLFKINSLQERFEYIYKTNFWPSSESLSGPGSELKNTENIRNEIKKIIKEYNIKTLLDVPCGDFNWMKLIIDNNISYTGGDIVRNLVTKNIKDFKKDNINFIHLDLIKDELPNAHLLLCRDCLIHFSIANILKLIDNLKKSKIDYLLLTSYEYQDKTEEQNIDIKDGDFRPIFLRQHPFNLPDPIMKILDKEQEHKNNSNLSCYLYLYSKKQLI